MKGDETINQHWSLPCPSCRRLLALDLTAEEVAHLSHDRPGIVRAQRPEAGVAAATIQRWNAQHARGCGYRVMTEKE